MSQNAAKAQYGCSQHNAASTQYQTCQGQPLGRESKPNGLTALPHTGYAVGPVLAGGVLLIAIGGIVRRHTHKLHASDN